MLFALRDEKKAIIAVSERQLNNDWEAVNLEDEDVRAFLQENPDISEKVMQAHDADFIRVLEDLLDLLMQKQVIHFTELPEPVQSKLLNRRRYREAMRELSDTTLLLEGDDEIF